MQIKPVSGWSKNYNGFKFRLVKKGDELMLQRKNWPGEIEMTRADSDLAQAWRVASGFN